MASDPYSRHPSGGAAQSPLRLGIERRSFSDAYHGLLKTSWPRLIGLLLLLYVGVNALFALLYLVTGGGIENARPGSFRDAFFFSVQTMATIGYGKMTPASVAANSLVTMEAATGMLGLSVGAGLMFAKFSRPTARVLFSRVALITTYEGHQSLVFRMANERANEITSAQIRLVLLRAEVTAEGESIRRLHDLPLRRSEHPIFFLTWTAVHRIDEHSPLYGATPEMLRAQQVSIICSLTGLDDTFAQTIYARHAYDAEDLVWNERFTDVLSRGEDGRLIVDYTKFHETYIPSGPRALPPET